MIWVVKKGIWTEKRESTESASRVLDATCSTHNTAYISAVFFFLFLCSLLGFWPACFQTSWSYAHLLTVCFSLVYSLILPTCLRGTSLSPASYTEFFQKTLLFHFFGLPSYLLFFGHPPYLILIIQLYAYPPILILYCDHLYAYFYTESNHSLQLHCCLWSLSLAVQMLYLNYCSFKRNQWSDHVLWESQNWEYLKEWPCLVPWGY